jgi:hypothetical protein
MPLNLSEPVLEDKGNNMYFFSGSAMDQTEGLVHAKHVLYHWAIPPALKISTSYSFLKDCK